MHNEFEKDVKDLQQVKEKVAYILEKYPKSRDNDKYLIVMVLRHFYKVFFMEDILRPDVPSIESIRRSRQQLQAKGFCPSQKQVAEAREHMEEVYRSYAKRG